MDQKPFTNPQQSPRPRLRVRNILLVVVLILFGYWIYTPSKPSSTSSPSSEKFPSPVYEHDRRLVKSWPGWSELKHIFFFGDSYTSTRFLPENAAPSESNPFGNPPFPGNVSHKRPLWSDYVVGTYNESFITAINLAWGGATVDDRLIVPFIDIIEGLNRQVGNNYLDKYANQSSSFPWTPQDSLFVFWFGINDVQGAWLWDNRTEVWRMDLGTYAENIEKVYATGARNFLFFNIPPIERAPISLALAPDLQTRKRADVAGWNAAVFRIVHEFTRAHNDTTAFWWDAWQSYSAVLDDPCVHAETCALQDVTGACPEYARLLGLEVLTSWEQSEPSCPYPLKQYFWMDQLHHGYHMHDVTAQGVVKMMKAKHRNYFAI